MQKKRRRKAARILALLLAAAVLTFAGCGAATGRETGAPELTGSASESSSHETGASAAEDGNGASVSIETKGASVTEALTDTEAAAEDTDSALTEPVSTTAADTEPENTETGGTEQSGAEPESAEGEDGMIYAHVNGRVLTILPAENSSAAAFSELLKSGDVTVKMHDYGGFEKVGPLGTSLPRNDTQITTSPGDVILYQGNQITIYYDVNSWSFTRLGKVQGLTQAELKEALGSGDASVTFSLRK